MQKGAQQIAPLLLMYYKYLPSEGCEFNVFLGPCGKVCVGVCKCKVRVHLTHIALTGRYDGKEILLSEGVVSSPQKFPELLHHVGEDLIVTDGHTLHNLRHFLLALACADVQIAKR